MNPKTYSVSFGENEVITVKSFNDPVGVVRALFGISNRYLPWQKLSDKVTLVDNKYKVEEILLDLRLVEWCG